jgi:hypothetical protein
MKNRILFIALLCVSLVALPSTATIAGAATDEDAVQMVESAGKMIELMGDAALPVISDPGGRCCDKERNLYVFVFNDNVVMMAHSERHDIIGVSFKEHGPITTNNQDASEIMVIKAMKEGSGWTDYPYFNPATEKISMKHTYSKLFRHDGKKYIVCCGVWHDERTSTVPSTKSVEYSY